MSFLRNDDRQLIRYKSASLTVSNKGLIESFMSRRQGEGHGTILLYVLCRIADDTGRELSLAAFPFLNKPKSVKELVKWYKGFGFRFVENRLDKMVRMVRKPNSFLLLEDKR